MNKHTYKIWNNGSWQTTYTTDDFREADRRGLVEHSEWCPCVSVTDNPPF